MIPSEKPKKNTLLAIQKKSENYKGLDKYYTKKAELCYEYSNFHNKNKIFFYS